MSIYDKIKKFLSLPFWRQKRTLTIVWLAIGLITALCKLHSHNNFDIFRGVFHHAIQQMPLYATYPAEYYDINHYGPLFSLIIAPFAVLPVWVSLMMWNVFLAWLLYWAIRRSTLPWSGQMFVLWFCANELFTALCMQQFNVATVALIILSYVYAVRGKEQWATLALVVGTLVKIYGIVGLPFFFFAKNKKRYLVWLVLWSVILFAAPMIISSPDYVISQYGAWMTDLGGKNQDNLLSFAQNISLLGIVRKALCAFSGGVAVDGTWTGGANYQYSDICLIALGCIVMAIGYFRVSQWKNAHFRQTVLAGILMFVCLFSTGTESSGYIIALVGCVIWYVSSPWQRGKWDIALMVFAFFVTSLSPTDIFPPFIRKQIIQPFALKALPVVFIWLKLVYEMITKDYCLAQTSNDVSQQ